jgi:hypothetical protein
VEFSDDEIEIMARTAHKAFNRSLISQGYHFGPEIDDELKTHPALVEYDKLPDDLKESNRATVRDIPHKLRQLGYRIEAGSGQRRLSTFSKADLERLAQLEHQRWAEHKLERGWTYGPKTDPARKIHASLVSWDELSEREREKDREVIRGIPKILAEIGYEIIAGE